MSLTGPTNKIARPRAGTGFTLLELVLVLVLLSVSAAMALPSLTRFSRGRETIDSAAHLLAVIQYAQDQSMNTGTPYRLQIDPTGAAYWLTMRRGGAFVALGTEAGRKFTLPVGVLAAWDASLDHTKRDYLQFDPDGGHEAAAVRLTARDGSVLLVGCDSATEPFRVSGVSGVSGASGVSGGDEQQGVR